MIKILVIFLIFSSTVFAAQMRLEFNTPVVKQGSLTDAVIRLDGESVQQVELQKLKGVSLANTVYLYQVSPLIRSGDTFEAEAKIIFLKVPESKPVMHKFGDKDVTVTWSDVEVQATEAPAQFLFGQFEIPGRRKLLQWFIALISLGLIIVGIYKFRQRSRNKNEVRKRKAELKDKILSAREYDDVVKLWQQKPVLIKDFPHLGEPFKELEIVLFKYQFKPSQNEAEKTEVMKAYRDFLNKVQGGFNGI